jgi:hypothetical protein
MENEDTTNSNTLLEDWQTAVDSVNQAIFQMDSLFKQIVDTQTVEEVCIQMSELQLIKASISMVYDTAAKFTADTMGNIGEVNLPNGVKIEKKTGADRKTWQHVDLAKNIASRLSDMSVDMSTGEVIMTPQEMVVKLLEYCAPSYWRVKELAKIGISADRFCEVSEPKTSIIIRRAK